MSKLSELRIIVLCLVLRLPAEVPFQPGLSSERAD